ncbi:MAG: NADH-quinone oxidoreductase subunit L [Acidimicrobiales bacterium]|nr:NADH-quinone oxidoreductase subunit L [Acidimicrobiales bacterium]MYH75547.1 NADH-quinone oxidoreductase subunit L [Acidimicrobiales bacterium]MYK70066.1 NADH-quinone oxidoreductase subunit L [Acidimicrobiales bacterium]
MNWFLENAFLIPLIPAVSFVVILLFGRSVIGVERVQKVGITAVGIVWILSMIAAVSWITRVEDSTSSKSDDAEHAQIAVNEGLSASAAAGVDGQLHLAAGDDGHGADDGHGYATTEPVISESDGWWSSGGVDFAVGTLVDGQTVLLLIVVTSISLLVHIYSSEYVKGDRRFVHYYAFLSLFTASMLFFVMAQNLVQMIVGWELVGVCSFVLIGHWWEERPNTDAAVKAFLTNRVGDIGLLVGVAILFGTFGTFDIDAINRAVGEMGSEVHFALLMASIALMAAVCSKSGQFPLHTWLPDAMAGPTPVSALIHAATMVVAGVFMIGRLYPVFFEGFSIGTSSINLMAFIGGFTALAGAGLAFAQWDIKKVLAYSTVSQLGYMVMALGVGAWTAAMFHLFTHAFFKACLFLGAGSVSHAAHHTFDMREMGGLRKYMPHTYKTFVISTLALAGIFPFAGFWSKDEILLGALAGQQNAYPLMLIFGCVVALLTAAYMTRVIWYTFWGEYRGHGHPHESPKVMTVPLWILAVMAVVAGAFNLPTPVLEVFGLEGLAHLVQTYAEPTHYLNAIGLSHPDPSLWLALFGLALALAGIAITFIYFWRNTGPHGLTERNRYAKAGYTFLEQKYYLDHLYTDIVVGSIKAPIARAANWVNDNVIDKVVNTAGEGARDSGRWVYRWIDQGTIDNTVNALGTGADAGGQGLRVMQTGKVQNYGSLLFGTAAVVAIVFVIVL